MLYCITDLSQLPPGRCLIFGSGGRGGQLLRALTEGRQDITVAGFLDSFRSGEAHGLPVRQWAGELPQGYDYVLLGTWAWGEVALALYEAGAPFFAPTRHVFTSAAERLAQAHADMAGRGFRPRSLSVQISNVCNMRCVMCCNAGRTKGERFMNEAVFARVVEQCARHIPDATIAFATGYGEPLLHPKLADFVRRVVAAGLKPALTTNGMLLDEPRLESLIEAGLTDLNVSFFGHDKASYEAIYKGGEFETVTANIRRAAARLAAPGLGGVGIAGMSLAEDFGAVRGAVRLLQFLGVAPGRIDISHPKNMGDALQLGPLDTELGMHTLRRADACCFDFCVDLQTSLGVRVNGDVKICSCTDAYEGDILGNIQLHELPELLNHAQRLRTIAAFAAGDLSGVPFCARCDEPYLIPLFGGGS